MSQSIAEMREAVRDGAVTASELVERALRSIDRVNPAINAVVRLAADDARAQARDADRARADGKPLGPLHGIPMTIKDSLDTKGLVTTAGTEGRRNFVPAADATVVERLRRAGAILLGKTNTSELTLSYQASNVIYGRTSNPYDIERSSGGSSGGSAAIVATGAVPFDVGSDTGGSLRIPAHYCGITTLKPTAGRVPRTGHIIGLGGHLDRLTTIGPLARRVEDLELVLSVIAGPDGHDANIAPAPLHDSRAVDLRPLRIGFQIENGVAEPTAATAAAVRNAASVLGGAVTTVTEVALPRAKEAPKLFADLYAADGGAWRRRILAASGTAVDPGAAEGLTGDRFSALLEEWDRFRRELLEFMNAWDVIICPVTSGPATRHGEGVASAFSYTQMFSLTGWPCVVVRCGTEGGLPIGLQVAARPWREDVAVRVAAFLETELGAWPAPALFISEPS